MALNHDEMVSRVKAEIAKAGSQRKAARKLGVTASFLCHVIRGNLPVSDRLANQLGYYREYTFYPVEESRGSEDTTTSALQNLDR